MIAPIPAEVFSERRRRLAEQLAKDGVDGLLVTDVHNVRYLTGFAGDSSFLAIGPQRSLMISDARYTEQIEEECAGLEAYIRRPGEQQLPVVADQFGKLGWQTIGIESASLTVAQFDTLRDLAKTVSFKPLSNRVEELRSIKDEHEVKRMREAIRIAESSYQSLLANRQSSDSEKLLADRLEFSMRESGATKAAFPIIVAFGARAGLPHAIPTATSSAGQEMMLIDWGAEFDGYRSDCTRTTPLGTPTKRFAEIYSIVLEAQKRAIAAIRPGVIGCDVDAVARNYISDAGFGAEFGHGLGHSLGLVIHEAPQFRPESKAVFHPGVVVTVEPGIYIKGWGGIRIEDMVLVTEDGHEVLNSLPKELDAQISVAS